MSNSSLEKQSYFLLLELFKSHVVFNLFTYREHKISYDKDKFPCESLCR